MRRAVVYLGLERVEGAVFDGFGKVWREVSRVSAEYPGGDLQALVEIFRTWGVSDIEYTLIVSDIYALGMVVENGDQDMRAAAAQYVSEHFVGMSVAWVAGRWNDNACCISVTERARLGQILQIVRRSFSNIIQVWPEGLMRASMSNVGDDSVAAAVQLWDDPRLRAVQLLNLDLRWQWLARFRSWRGILKVAALVPLMLAMALEWTTWHLEAKRQQLARQMEAHVVAVAASERQKNVLERLEKVAAEFGQMHAEQIEWVECLSHVQKVCEDYGPVWVEDWHIHDGRKVTENADVTREDWARSLHLWMHFATLGEGWEACKRKIQTTLATLSAYRGFSGMERVQVLAQTPGWLKLQCELKLRERKVL